MFRLRLAQIGVRQRSLPFNRLSCARSHVRYFSGEVEEPWTFSGVPETGKRVFSLANEDYVLGKAVEYSKKKSRSRIVKRGLNTGSTELRAKIIETLLPNIVELAKHDSGKNIVVACLPMMEGRYGIEMGTSDITPTTKEVQRILTVNAYEIALDFSGCFTLTNCMEKSSPSVREALIGQLIKPTNQNRVYFDEFKREKDTTGNPLTVLVTHGESGRVLQAICKYANDVELGQISEAVFDSIMEICLTKNGLKFIRAYLPRANDKAAIIDQLINPMGENKKYLSSIKEGETLDVLFHTKEGCNLLVLLSEEGPPDFVNKIHERVMQDTMKLALNHSSVDFLIAYMNNTTPEHRSTIINQLLHPTADNESYFSQFKTEKELENCSLPEVLALNQCGSFVLEVICEHVSVKQAEELMKKVANKAVQVSLSKYGRHVAKKLFEKVGAESREAFARALLDPTSDDEVYLNKLKEERKVEGESGFVLLCDREGSFVMQSVCQHVLENEKLQGLMSSNILKLCVNKYAAYGVQEYLKSATSLERKEVFEELVSPTKQNLAYLEALREANGDEDLTSVKLLTQDTPGCFVLQTLVEVLEESEKQVLLEHISEHKTALESTKWGKGLVAAIGKESLF